MTKETETDEVIRNSRIANAMTDKTHVIENTTWAVPASKNVTIYSALLTVQIELPTIENDATNPHLKNKYSSLKSVLKTVLPVLQKHKILLTYSFDAENVIASLVHVESGECITTSLPLKGAVDMQKMGSAITYARRYLLLSLLGICSELDDDDGNMASNLKSFNAKIVTDAFNKTSPVLIKSQPLKETPAVTSNSTYLQESILTLWENCWVEAYEMDNDLAQKIKMHIENDFKNASVESLTKMKTWLISVNKKD
ncbi:MAG: Anabaena phage [Pseudomonadota bacterium]|jgi:hypothetical protein